MRGAERERGNKGREREWRERREPEMNRRESR